MSFRTPSHEPRPPQDLTLRALIHSLPDQFYRLRYDGTILDLELNDIPSPLESVSEVGARIQDSGLPEEIRHAYMRGILQSLASGKVQTVYYELEVEGHAAFREVRIFPCADDEVVALIRDITERTQADRERLKLLQAVEQSPVLIMITDLEGRIEYVNPKFTAVTGYSLQEVQGKRPSLLKSGEMTQSAYEDLWKTIKSGGTWRGEFHNVNKWGQMYWESATIAPRLDSEGRPSKFIGFKEEITERKRVEAALRETSKRESLWLMAGGIAHDFNNLFQGILGNLEVARMGVEAGSTTGRALDRALSLLERASALAQNMLEYAGKSPHHVEAVNCNLLIQNLAGAQGRTTSGLTFRTELEPMLPQAAGDSTQVHRILEGLLANAQEALVGAEGTVWLGTSSVPLTEAERLEGYWVEPAPEGQVVRFWVEDHGRGIDAEHLSRIFDPFFTTKTPGRGLGLPAILGITRAHHGGLQVLSRPGQGTRVQICLPLFEDYEKTESSEYTGSHRAMPGPPGILVADDEDDLRITLAEALADIYGYRVFQARDGLESLDVFSQYRDEIDLVVADVLMPRMKGPEAFAAMKAAKPSLRGILISGFSDESGHQLASTFNFNTFLKKPFGLAVLVQALQEALGPRRV